MTCRDDRKPQPHLPDKAAVVPEYMAGPGAKVGLPPPRVPNRPPHKELSHHAHHVRSLVTGCGIGPTHQCALPSRRGFRSGCLRCSSDSQRSPLVRCGACSATRGPRIRTGQGCERSPTHERRDRCGQSWDAFQARVPGTRPPVPHPNALREGGRHDLGRAARWFGSDEARQSPGGPASIDPGVIDGNAERSEKD